VGRPLVGLLSTHWPHCPHGMGMGGGLLSTLGTLSSYMVGLLSVYITYITHALSPIVGCLPHPGWEWAGNHWGWPWLGYYWATHWPHTLAGIFGSMGMANSLGSNNER